MPYLNSVAQTYSDYLFGTGTTLTPSIAAGYSYYLFIYDSTKPVTAIISVTYRRS